MTAPTLGATALRAPELEADTPHIVCDDPDDESTGWEDDDGETALSPADAWWNGHADGSRNQPMNPPAGGTVTECELYRDGFAVGAKELKAKEEGQTETAASDPDIPF